ncbi:MAG: ABC transporter permease [Candidatus Atribacteria bacterium]|nr:ABC transporter permease [Candidatus Atribacteria bacterium]
MNWKNIYLIYRKEILGAVRDRRTFISMIVLPLIFYPLLFLGIGYFSLIGQQKYDLQPSTIFVIGTNQGSEIIEMFNQDEKIHLIHSSDSPGEVFKKGELCLSVEIIENHLMNLKEDKNLTIIFQYDSTRQDCQLAKKRVIPIIEAYRQKVVKERLDEIGLTIEYLQPVQEEWQDIAPEEKKMGSILGMILPYIIIILIFIGAMHSAIDITAGEKERGTLATLLVSQLSRLEIVLGKYFTVMSISTTSMILGLIGLSIAFLTPAYAIGELSLIRVHFNFPIFLLVLMPMVSLTSAILILIGIYARNNKEASTYVTPIYMIAIFLGMISLSQGTELASPLFFIPILSNSFIFKELLIGTIHWGHMISSIASNLFFSLFALMGAMKFFSREDVLFRS